MALFDLHFSAAGSRVGTLPRLACAIAQSTGVWHCGT